MRAAPGRAACCSQGSLLMFLNFAACRGLEPALFKLLAALAHHADPAGTCDPLQATIAKEIRMSPSTVCRGAAELERREYLVRTRIGDGHYRYRIETRFLTDGIAGSPPPDGDLPKPPKQRWRARQSTCTSATSTGATACSGASPIRASAPVKVLLSSGSKEPSERELSLSRMKFRMVGKRRRRPSDASQASARSTCRAEWRKLVAYSEGARITIWRWRGWALKARCDRRHRPAAANYSSPHRRLADRQALPGDERQQRQARDWVRRGFWLRDGSWGPAPDQPGCSLPADLVAWCLRERAALAAA